MGGPAGNSRTMALTAHKSTNLDKWDHVLATATKELAIDSNFASMTMEYNADSTINHIDIVKNVGGTNQTVRIAFTYTAAGLVKTITKAVV